MSDPNILPPENVWPPPPQNTQAQETIPVYSVQDVGQQSALLVWLLDTITFGFYTYYWMYNKIKTINRIMPSYSIDMGGFYAIIIGHSCIFIYSGYLLATGHTEPASFSTFSNGVSITLMILSYRILFMIVDRLNTLVNADLGDQNRFSKVWAFIFTVVYLQYKINKLNKIVTL